MLRILTGLLALVTAAGAVTMPLYFEPNLGQAHPRVQYVSRGNGVTAYLADNAVAFSVGGSSLVMRLEGARPRRMEARDRLPGFSAYFTGNDRSKWRANVPQFGKILYQDVYPGIDLVYYGHEGRLEYDFELAPGADPRAIRVAYDGATNIRMDRGDLVIATAKGQLRHRRPVVYQNAGAARTMIQASYVLYPDRTVGFQLAAYDRTRPVVVDPVVEYATYLGGSGIDAANAVKVDSSGNVYLAGSVAMPSPGGDPFVPATPDAYDSAAVVIKYSPSQKAILSVAQLGSEGISGAGRLDVDATGAIYLTGTTDSARFPLMNAVNTENRAHAFTPFVAKIAADGRTLVFSTYFGGTGLDQYGSIAAGPDGSAYVTGTAVARDFTLTDRTLDTSHGSRAFLAKFNPDGSLGFSRLFGSASSGASQGSGIALDDNGNIYITGATSVSDFPVKNAFQSSFRKDPLLASMLGLRAAFAAKFTSDGKTLVYSTLLGGDGDDAATSAAVDRQGNLYIAGSTTSTDLPVVNPVQDRLGGMQNGFIAELNPQGNALLFLTYAGGSSKDQVHDVAVDSSGNIYAAGEAESDDFPLRKPIAARTPNGPNAFAMKFAPGGRGLLFSTLIGGSQDDRGSGIAADSNGAAYLAGQTGSADLPLINAFQASYGGQRDMFLVKLAPDAAPPASIIALPSSVTFTMVTGGSAPAPQVIDITPPAGGMPGAFTAAVEGSWLSVTPGTGSSPGQIAVSVNPVGLGIGVYSGVVQITADGGPATDIPVVFRVTPPTPVLASVTPAQFDVAHFDVLNPPATLPAITLTISGSNLVSGATAWVTTFVPENSMSYATTFVDANTVQVTLPLSVQATLLSIRVSNPGTPPSNPLNLMEGKPLIGAARVTGTIAPGQMVVISGINVGPLAPFLAPKDGTAVTALGNTQVLFDGVPAQLVSAYFREVRAIVPEAVATRTSTNIVVRHFDQSSPRLAVAVGNNPSPANPLGPGVSAVLNPDGSLNSESNPVAPDSVVKLVIDNAQLAPGWQFPPSVTINGITAPLVPMDNTIGIAGKLQFQVRVPASIASGAEVPVVAQFRDPDFTIRLGMWVK